MAFLIGLLTLVMVLDCLLLILLVLIQLPKKEAGAGIAFGASATDALFGAGSGTVLTKITKYAAGAFFLMAVVLSLLQNSYHRGRGTEFEGRLKQQEQPSLPTTLPPSTTVPKTTSSNLTISTTQAVEATNIPAVTSAIPAVSTPSSNAPAATNPTSATPTAPK